MQKRSIVKKILYGLSALILLIAAAIWIFFSFYFEDALNRYAVPRLTEAARVATHGKYHLTLGRISYSGGSVFCKSFLLARTGYDSGEHGNTVKKVSIDSVRFIGVSWWDAVFGNDMRMTSIEMNAPKIYFTNIDKERETLQDLPADTFSQVVSTPKTLPVISFDSITLKNVSVFLPDRSADGAKPSFRDIELKLTDFLLDSKTLAAQPLLYSERVDFSMPSASYVLDDSDYSLELRNIRGSFSDSLLAIDSFAYKPNFSKQAFAARHKYVQPRLDFRCSDIRIRAINFVKLIGGQSLNFRSCVANVWSLDFFSDRRVHDDPHPPNAVLPNDIIRSIKIPISVDSLILDHGSMHWAEQWPGVEPGTLTFSHVRIAAFPICTDSLGSDFRASTRITVKALFLGEAPVDATMIYPLHDKQVNFTITATVGAFDARKLNTELKPIERLEVTEGAATHGVIRMNVQNGVATTTVTPEYHDLSIKVLAKEAKESRGIMEWIKTFAANVFALRKNNMNTEDKKAYGATTTLRRTPDQEFLQCVWLALRKSLAKAIGF